jgi:hypothetical protein
MLAVEQSAAQSGVLHALTLGRVDGGRCDVHAPSVTQTNNACMCELSHPQQR